MKKIVAGFLSSLYHAGLVACQASYRAIPFRIRKVPARVISIGNLTWGGTGKTPLTAKLAQNLADMGKKVAVLTRGYGEDEVAELRKKLPGIPVIVGRDRVKSAREAIAKHGAEILILDDGFQHIRLNRDIDVVNINSLEPFGPGGLIPLGTLREPVAHLSRAHVFVLSKSDLGKKNLGVIRQKLLAVKPDAVIFEAVHRPVQFTDALRSRTVPLAELKGHKIATICAIGDPFSFEKTVENVGAEIVFAARFDDHHPYTKEELLQFVRSAREIGAREVVTTEKDFFRIEPLLKTDPELTNLNFLVLEIELELNDEEDFVRRCLNP